MSDEAGAFDAVFDAAQQRNDAERHSVPSTLADDLADLLRLESTLKYDALSDRERRLITQEYMRLKAKVGLLPIGRAA